MDLNPSARAPGYVEKIGKGVDLTDDEWNRIPVDTITVIRER